MNKTLIILIFFASCSFEGSFGGLIGYQKKIIKEAPNLIVMSNSDICNQVYEAAKIFCVNGKELLECISKEENSIVYIWQPHCSSEICLPLKTVEKISDSLDAKLYIVAEYYDIDKMKVDYKLNTPILGIDSKYYKSSFTKKYLGGFLKDLNVTSDTYFYDYYCFKNGELRMKAKNYKGLF